MNYIIWNYSPTPAQGNANGISEIIKQKEKGAVIVPGMEFFGNLVYRRASLAEFHRILLTWPLG